MKIGFLGAGNMASAIINNLINNNNINTQDIKLVVRSQTSCDKWKKQKFHVSLDWNFLNDCDVIFLGLKPQDIFNLKDNLQKTFTDKIIISLAAGISLATLNKIFVTNQVTRIMTNPAIAYEKAGLMITEEGNEKCNKIVTQLFNNSATIITWKETNIHLFIALSASANAFVYHLLQPLVNLGLDQGINPTEVNQIISLLLLTCSKTISNSNLSLEELINQITSPKGTTLAGLDVFKANDLQAIITKGLTACINRSKELEKQND